MNYYIKSLKQLSKNTIKKILHLKKKNKSFDFFILFFGLLGYYFEYYLLTLYSIVHFSVLFGQYLSKDFKVKVENFKKDQITIKNHYLEDFKIVYYSVFVIRLITFLFYFYFFSLDIEKMSSVGDIFYAITYIFIIAGFIDLGIILYIIFYKNNPVVEVAANVCYHCVTKGLPLAGALHVSSNVPFISPNPLSNEYHKWSPIGRGYGVWSSGQLLQIDYLKTHLGKNFNYHEIIDADKMVDPTKLKMYAQKKTLENDINFKTFTDVATSKPKNS